MKILHTADWHLGASLGFYSRLGEQKLFLQQLNKIIKDEKIDLVLVAGDIFDAANPPAAAERLFYDALADFAAHQVPVVLIAGNHDSPDRLTAASSITSEMGVYTFATPGCCEIAIGDEVAVVAAMPFISEKRLNQAIFGEGDENVAQKDYSAKIGEIYLEQSTKFRKDTVNIAMGHFHLKGGVASGGGAGDLERDIMLGGVFAVNPQHLPRGADYVALGHLHRPHQVAENAYYAGSPLPYSLSERHPKAVYVAEIGAGGGHAVEKILLNTPKPLELWEVQTAEEAINRCKMPSNAYVYISISGEAALNPHDIKEMHRLKADIVAIGLAQNLQNSSFAENLQPHFSNLTPREEFINFYKEKKGAGPGGALLSVFDEILVSMEREGDDDETDFSDI